MAGGLENLKVFPLVEAIRIESRDQILSRYKSAADRDRILDALAKQPPEIRAALLLGLLDDTESPQGFRMFFYSPSGDFAPEIAEVMRTAGLQRHLKVVADAIELYGPKYPIGRVAGRRLRGVANEDNVDAQLMSMNQKFRDAGDFSAEVERFVRASPSAFAYFEAKRRSASASDRFDWLDYRLAAEAEGPLDERNMPASLYGVAEPYRLLWATFWYEAETGNGGVNQFFDNPSGALAPLVVEVFASIGLSNHSEALSRGVNLFGEIYPYDTETRRELIEMRPGFEGLCDEIGRVADPWSDEYIQARIRFAENAGILPN